MYPKLMVDLWSNKMARAKTKVQTKYSWCDTFTSLSRSGVASGYRKSEKMQVRKLIISNTIANTML